MMIYIFLYNLIDPKLLNGGVHNEYHTFSVIYFNRICDACT